MCPQTLVMISALIRRQNTASLITLHLMNGKACEGCRRTVTPQGRSAQAGGGGGVGWEGWVRFCVCCNRGWGVVRVSGVEEGKQQISRKERLYRWCPPPPPPPAPHPHMISLCHVLCILRNNLAKAVPLKASSFGAAVSSFIISSFTQAASGGKHQLHVDQRGGSSYKAVTRGHGSVKRISDSYRYGKLLNT